MSKPNPYTMTIGEDGLSVRCELDVHYLTDEQLEAVRKHVETLERMNVLLREENGRLQIESGKLRELVRTLYHCTTSGECDECPINGGGPVHLMPDTICDTIHDRMRELGVDA